MNELTEKQKVFCEEYLKDLNGTQAAIRAGYTPDNANSTSCVMLANPNIQIFIQELKEKRSKRTDITADKILKELAKIGFSNLQDFIKEGFTISDIQKLKRSHAAAIESIKVKTTSLPSGQNTSEVTFKLHDKLAALDKLARHIGFFEKDNEQSKQDVSTIFYIPDDGRNPQKED